jgi:hypothetical protein
MLEGAKWWETQIVGPPCESEAIELKEMGSSAKPAELSKKEETKPEEKKQEEKKRDGKKRYTKKSTNI